VRIVLVLCAFRSDMFTRQCMGLTYGHLRSRLLLLLQPALPQIQQARQAVRSVSPFGVVEHPRVRLFW
jgi:hypothetical protein